MMSIRLASLASRPALALALALVFLPLPRLWGEDSSSRSTVAETPSTSAEESLPAPLGVTVFVDPETGELTDRPTAEQEAWLRQELQRRGKTSATPETFQSHPVPLLQGGEGLALHDFVVSSTVVLTQPGGAWTTTCRRDGVPHSHVHPALESAPATPVSTSSDTPTSTDAAPVM